MAIEKISAKKEMAYLYFMQGFLQKEICEKVGISAVTLSKWKKDNAWEEKRSASNITRPELTNKILKSISNLLDDSLQNKNKDVSGLADKLTKLASAIEKLDKKNTVINDIETFTNFNQWLQARLSIDAELHPELIKSINKYQDIYVHERLNK